MLTTHNVSLESAVETELDCTRCGFAGTATVHEKGIGRGGTSLFGLGRAAAEAEARHQAVEDLAHQAKVQARLLVCPQCRKRSATAVAMFVAWTVLALVVLGVGAGFAKIYLRSWLLAGVFVVGALSFLIGRAYQYRRAGNPLGIRLRPRVPEARAVKVPVARPREPDLPPSDQPRVLR